MSRPSLTAILVGPEDPRWRQLVSEVQHDVYHLPEYVDFAAGHQEAGEPMAFLAESGDSRLLIPLIVRDVPPTLAGGRALRDATAPRGYPGPVEAYPTGSHEHDEFLERSLSAFRAVLRDRGVVSAFIRLHPLLTRHREALARHGGLVYHGDSVAIDLGMAPPDLWKQTRRDHRRAINRARRLGYVVRIDERLERLEEFARIYAQTMHRLNAADRWRLPARYFTELSRSLGQRVHLCVVEDDGRLAAGALLTEEDGIVEYHLSGTSDPYVDMSPSKSIIHFASRWARDRGNRFLHLAGSLQPSDSLLQFKLGFSPARYPVVTWRVVTDPGAYTSLCASLGSNGDTPVDPSTAYFPAYRRPIHSSAPAIASQPGL